MLIGFHNISVHDLDSIRVSSMS